MHKLLQHLGRSLMLSVTILPTIAIVVGMGHVLDALNILPQTALFFTSVGTTILERLSILFAIGVAIDMAKKNSDAVALAAALGLLIVTVVLSPEELATLLQIKESKIDLTFSQMDNGNVFAGTIIGLIAAYSHNEFSETNLLMALSFFGGKRLVPIMTAFFCTILAIILLLIWPPVYNGIVTFGEWTVGTDPFDALLYGFFNRLLTPTGLHHALNSVFRSDTAGMNDMGKFQSGKSAIRGITSRYQAGFFPVMISGASAAVLTIYHTAKTNQKKQVYAWFLASSVLASFVGVTEPIEFTFMFVAPVLFVIHAVLTGLSLFITAIFHWIGGFSFNASLIDYVLSLINLISNQPWMLLLQGVIFFIICYVILKVVIQVLNLSTIGRGDNELIDPISNDTSRMEVLQNETATNKYYQNAKRILGGLGGKENIISLNHYATRLRLEPRGNSIIDEQKTKNAGAIGITQNGHHYTQVIIGTHVQQIANEMDHQMN